VNRPIVVVNFALTFDGKISTRNLTPSDFSSKRDKRRLLEIRATGDALLVGKGTLEKENMSMGLPAQDLRATRIQHKRAPYPLRVIVTNSGRIKLSLRIFEKAFSPIVIYSTQRMPLRTQHALREKATLHLHESATVDLNAMLAHLRSAYKVKRLICEGGPTLLRGLLARDLVDEIHLTFCPRIFGGETAPTLSGLPGEFLPRTLQCKLSKMEVIGDEGYARYTIVRTA